MWYTGQNDILILGSFNGFLTNKYRANDTDGVFLAQISTIRTIYLTWIFNFIKICGCRQIFGQTHLELAEAWVEKITHYP